MRSGAELSCEVHAGGERLADTAEQWEASTPTVLGDLSVRWGRASVAEQPEASACSFTIADRHGDADFLRLLRVGRQIDVYAGGELIGDGDPVNVAVDGTFDTAPAERAAAAGGVTLLPWDTGHEDNPRALFASAARAVGGTVGIPLAPWGTVATAWDDLPTVHPGERWSARLDVTTGRGVRANVTAALFTDPRMRGPGTPVGEPAPVPRNNARTVVLDVDMPTNARGWLGVRVDLELTPWLDEPAAWQDLAGTWAGWRGVILDGLMVFAPARAQRRVLVFGGRITDLDAGVAARGIAVRVTAVDASADLANDVIGDEPWKVQTIGERVARIRTLARTPFDVDLDERPAALRVSYRDVDAQPVHGLLTELAESADAVLWPAAHLTRGAYLWLEDTDTRAALGLLRFDPDVELVVAAGGNLDRGVTLSACDLDAETIHWRSDVADVLTRVDLTWLEQTVDEEGKPEPTERHVVVVDEAAEDPARGNLGVRRAGYSTQLVDAEDGRDVANRVLARSRGGGWHADGLTWDTVLPQTFDDANRQAALDLLDGTRRIGLPVIVRDLPAWSPGGDALAANVEGGTWTYAGGRWTFEATISPSGATGYSASWADLDPAWSWNEFDTRPGSTITWWSLWGLAAEYASPRWSQLVGTWAEQTKTWEELYGPQRGEEG